MHLLYGWSVINGFDSALNSWTHSFYPQFIINPKFHVPTRKKENLSKDCNHFIAQYAVAIYLICLWETTLLSVSWDQHEWQNIAASNRNFGDQYRKKLYPLKCVEWHWISMNLCTPKVMMTPYKSILLDNSNPRHM